MNGNSQLDWSTTVVSSLETVHKFYGKVLSTTYPTDSDPQLRIEYKINTGVDLLIDESIIIDIEVDHLFPTTLPRIYIRSHYSFFEQIETVKLDENRLIVTWMEKGKFPLPVWIYALRRLFHNSRHPPWETPSVLQIHFSLNNGEPTISPPSLIGGTGRIRGKRMYMEDVDFCHTISPLGKTVTIYGVLDGHGGQECARYASEEIPSNIISSLCSGVSLKESLFHSYLKTDSQFIKSNTSQLKAGSTSTVMLFDHQTGHTSVANSGDTRAVLSRLRTAIDLTRDMKSSNPIEIARILSSGGSIVNGRVLGSLAVSRALGDCQLKEINEKAVIADPEITSFYFQSDDEFVVIATDGLWDVMSSQTVVDMIWSALSEQQLYPIPSNPDESYISYALGKIGENLANHACNNLNSADNITATIILLRHSSNPYPISSTSSSSLPSSTRHSFRQVDSTVSEGKTSPSNYSSSKSYETDKSSSSSRGVSTFTTNTSSSAAAATVTAATEKRKTESHVTDDDLMRFLMDDSNF